MRGSSVTKHDAKQKNSVARPARTTQRQPSPTLMDANSESFGTKGRIVIFGFGETRKSIELFGAQAAVQPPHQADNTFKLAGRRSPAGIARDSEILAYQCVGWPSMPT
jgi:hypothetical protein